MSKKYETTCIFDLVSTKSSDNRVKMLRWGHDVCYMFCTGLGFVRGKEEVGKFHGGQGGWYRGIKVNHEG